MISVNDVTITFSGENLFDGISFIIGDKDRIGLVGKNGAGKSTLLKVITSEVVPTSGGVSFSGDSSIGYLAQQMRHEDGRTVVEEAMLAFSELLELEATIARLNEQLAVRTDYHSDEYEKILHNLSVATDHFHIMDSGDRESQVERTLLGLGFKRSDFTRQTQEFSGGWRMRIELAKILLRNPSVMLLDEPTNHLDIESITWLEEYLQSYRGAVVVISHDRRFLDTVTTRTVEILLGQAHDYKVPYSKYEVLRAERRKQQQASYDNQQKMIRDTEDFIERFRYKATKSNQVQSRIKQLEKIDLIEIDETDNSRMNMRFAAAPRSGQIVLEVKGVGKAFGDKRIFSGAEFTLERGDKIALVGRNGEGKTTFARMVVGQTEVTDGSLRLGHNVMYGYYAQNQEDLMEGEFTVFDTLDKVAVGDVRTKLRDILGAFLFKGDDVDKKVKVLSGGERSRLAMARLMLNPYNLLVLDEPTNHMDMRSKDVLKQSLMQYDGTLIVVSHDREFLDGLVNKVYEFSDGRVREHLGGISDFLRNRKIESMASIEAKPTVQAGAPQSNSSLVDTSTAVSVGKLSYEQQKERERLQRKKRSDLAKAEQLIADIEASMESLSSKLSDPSAHNIDLSTTTLFSDYKELENSLEQALEQWEILSNELN